MMEQYADLKRETKGKLLSYADSQDWQVLKKSNGVTVTAHQETGIPAKVFKAECVVNISPSDLFEHVSITGSTTLPSSSKGKPPKKPPKKPIDLVQSWEMLKEIDTDMFIIRSVSKSYGGGMISPREYIDFVFNEKDPIASSFLSCATGVDSTYPESSKYIRGRNYPSGILCLPVSGELEKTRVVYIIHTNLCGRIPNKIIDIAIPSSQINFFSRLLKEISNSS